jgi:hypothetical protein
MGLLWKRGVRCLVPGDPKWGKMIGDIPRKPIANPAKRNIIRTTR